MELDRLDSAGTSLPYGISQRLATCIDPKGRTWGLFQSGVLGHPSDLWLAERRHGRWDRPLFTGVRRETSYRWSLDGIPEPTIGGRTGDELVGGAWSTTLVGREEISRDRDGDGLNDLAEARLGTDPRRRDTDGDGEGDETDPMPTAPWRELTEEETIFAAAFEAFGRTARPKGETLPQTDLIEMPNGLAPFEMVARSGPLLWRGAFGSPETDATSGTGSGRPRYGTIHYGFSLIDTGTRVLWNPDRTFAYVFLWWQSGPKSGAGYSIGVKRIGAEWFVVDVAHSFEI